MTESTEDSLDYLELSSLLKLVGYTEAPAHFHGALCGALCVLNNGQFDIGALVMEGADSGQPLDPNSRIALDKLSQSCAADLMSTDMVFEPLLPPDSTPLRIRIEALAAWCGGFLYGLSSKQKIDIKKLSEEARETIKDLAQFTSAGFDATGVPEEEEAAYVELVEYVRVAAQLLFLEMRPRTASVDDESSTLH
tara:strand:+ start:5972 stop:6553 length:582 start_codon:yes stop_codon:yes gene_type:complete